MNSGKCSETVVDANDINQLKGILDEGLPYVYFSDRESPWLLYHLMAGDKAIPELKRSPLGKLLNRPLVKPFLANSRGEMLRRDDLYPVAEAEPELSDADMTAAKAAALAVAFNAVWRDYKITFGTWGGDNTWYYQVSRPGHNLVLQLSFPSDHAELAGRFWRPGMRSDFEDALHPVQTQGAPTLAWARLDIDLEAGVALIEEIQSDWLRLVAYKIRVLGRNAGSSRELDLHVAYLKGLETRYSKEWPRATMLAALKFLRVECGCHTVYLHTPESNEGLKSAGGPRSLYTSLPKYFCFELTEDVPPFLQRRRRADLKRLRKKHVKLFWKLRFEDE